MKPLQHATLSVNRWGGELEDYLPIHDFLDSSKAHIPDVRHRAILHSSFGCFIAERVFGPYITTSKGRKVATRDVAEHHIIEDLGTIPTVQDWLGDLPVQDWMSRRDHRTEDEDPEVADAPAPEPDVPAWPGVKLPGDFKFPLPDDFSGPKAPWVIPRPNRRRPRPGGLGDLID